MGYTYDRRSLRQKTADSESLQHVVAEYLLMLAEQVSHSIAHMTHAHVKTSMHKEYGQSVEAQIIARAGDLIHDFKVQLSVDSHLNVIGILDYTSLGAGGQKGRSKSMAFDLPSQATPGHFVQQIAEAAMEQYQGKRAPVDVRMLAATWKA
jgi:uracil phosphoribosyltransferase